MARFGHAGRHPQVLEAARRIPSQMLEMQPRHAGKLRRPLCSHHRHVAFTQRHHSFCRILRQRFTESPYAARVNRRKRASALRPQCLQRSRILLRSIDRHLQQLAALRARHQRRVQVECCAARGANAMQMGHARFLRMGRHRGGCARKCSLPISASAASSACWLHGSSVMANGSASRECPGSCSTASTLIA